MAAKKKLNLFYLRIKVLTAYQQIIQFIFEHLPIFLDANAMLDYAKVNLDLEEAEKIYCVIKTDEAVDEIIPKLEQGLQKLQEILKYTLTELQQALLKNHSKVFITKIISAKKLWQRITDGANELEGRINNNEVIRNTTIQSFEKVLAEFTESAKNIWKLLQPNLKKPSKKLLQKYLALTQEILKERALLGGGKWLSLNNNPVAIIGLAQKILKSECIKPMLEQMLELFKNYCIYILEHKINRLQEFFDKDYEEAYDAQQELLFLRNWLHILESKSKFILAQQERGITFALQVKKLVYSIKNGFYMEFYNSEKRLNVSTIIELDTSSQKNSKLASDAILNKLYEQQEIVETKIKKIETKLKSYGWFVGFTTSAIRLWTENFSFRWSKGFFVAADDITHRSFQQNSLLGTKLTDTSINIWSSALASIILSVDIYSSKRFGAASYTLLTTISRAILSDLTTIMTIAYEFDIDKKTVVKNITKMEEALNFCIMVGFNTLVTGISTGNLVYFSGAYLAATMARRLIGKLYNKYIVDSTKQQQLKVAGFGKSIVQYGGFIVGSKVWRKFYMTAHSFFYPPTTKELLQSKELCLQHETLCRKTMAEILQINPYSDVLQVKKRWRKLAAENHPDLVDDTERKYTMFNNAKTRFIEIIKKKNPQINLK